MKSEAWNWRPMKWHFILTKIIVPLATTIAAVNLVVWTRDLAKHGWAYSPYLAVLIWCDIGYALARVSLGVAAIIGCMKRVRRWYGPKCVLGLYAVVFGYSAFCIFIGLQNNLGSADLAFYIGQMAGSGVVGYLTFVYYRRRRMLFVPYVETGTSTSAATKYNAENSLELLARIQRENDDGFQHSLDLLAKLQDEQSSVRH